MTNPDHDLPEYLNHIFSCFYCKEVFEIHGVFDSFKWERFHGKLKKHYETHLSGCEDCDYLHYYPQEEIKSFCPLGFYVCNERKELIIITGEDLTDDLTHIEPPSFCPGGCPHETI